MAKQSPHLRKEVEAELRQLRRENRCFFHRDRYGVGMKSLQIKALVYRQVPLCAKCWAEYAIPWWESAYPNAPKRLLDEIMGR